MTLFLLHPLLAGLALASLAIPIAIHLLFRQRPRVVALPSMMFLQKKKNQTMRRIRLRHWFLLLCRCLVLLLLGLAMARPTLRSKFFSIDQEAPLGVAFVIDDSASMALTERGRTRLDAAQELAKEAASRLPKKSDVLVIQSSHPVAGAKLDGANAQARIDALTGDFGANRLGEAVRTALEALAESTRARKELYIFSDQAEHAWVDDQRDRWASQLEELGEDIVIYIVDVHSEDRGNVAIAEWKLSSEVISQGAEAKIDITVRNTGPDVDSVVRLILDGQPRSEQPMRVSSDSAVTLSFPLGDLAEGLHQGEVRLAVEDRLSLDDQRFFTIDVRPTANQLVVAHDPRDALYWMKALTPEPNADARVRWVTPAELGRISLSRVDLISLINVEQLSQSTWVKLSDFVGRGGGLFVAVGARVDAENYASPAARQLFGFRLGERVEPPQAIFTIDDPTHPISRGVNRFGESDLGAWPVLRYLKVDTGNVALTPILSYSTGDPALIERTFTGGSQGRLLVLTTAAHYEPQGEPWNELPLGWSYLLMVEEISRYLAGASETRLNFLVGQTVTLSRKPTEPFTVYAITAPDETVERLSVDPLETDLRIPSLRMPGQYEVNANARNRVYTSGFSVNVAPVESQTTPVAPEEIKAIFDPAEVAVVRDAAELVRVEGSSRVGRELFPWLILLVAAALFAEAYFSNRFYRSTKAAA